jgi:thiol:disulfide interchange protein DsbA
MTRRVLLPLLLLALAACGKTEAPTTTAPTAQATAAMPASADEPAASTSAAPVSASTGAPAPNAAADAAAQKALAATDPSGLVEGTDYVTIKGGEPWKPLDGKIEVVEVFGYVCPACAAFDPLVSAWKAKLPADVRFSYVPAPFGPEWNPYAKAFYVAESMGLVDRSHSALIHEIHITQDDAGRRRSGRRAEDRQLLRQVRREPEGIPEHDELVLGERAGQQGPQFMIRSGANSTPTLIVNGKYKVTGNSFEDMLRIASGLIAKERAAGGAPAAAAPSQG